MFIAMNRFSVLPGEEKAFEAWTKSEAFRRAHAGEGTNKPLYAGHPNFEGFEVIQEVLPA